MVIQKWKQFEKKLGKEFEGKRQPGSGNQWYKPGDLLTDDKRFLIEAKQTDNKSFSITKKLWEKIYESALFKKRLPILAIKLQDTELVALDKNDFLALVSFGK